MVPIEGEDAQAGGGLLTTMTALPTPLFENAKKQELPQPAMAMTQIVTQQHQTRTRLHRGNPME
jgi:hypothetical protein